VPYAKHKIIFDHQNHVQKSVPPVQYDRQNHHNTEKHCKDYPKQFKLSTAIIGAGIQRDIG